MSVTPPETPPTKPVEVATVATEISAELHAPPERLLLRVVDAPTHTVAVPVIEGTTGSAFTVTTVVAYPVHPNPSVKP